MPPPLEAPAFRHVELAIAGTGRDDDGARVTSVRRRARARSGRSRRRRRETPVRRWRAARRTSAPAPVRARRAPGRRCRSESRDSSRSWSSCPPARPALRPRPRPCSALPRRRTPPPPARRARRRPRRDRRRGPGRSTRSGRARRPSSVLRGLPEHAVAGCGSPPAGRRAAADAARGCRSASASTLGAPAGASDSRCGSGSAAAAACRPNGRLPIRTAPPWLCQMSPTRRRMKARMMISPISGSASSRRRNCGRLMRATRPSTAMRPLTRISRSLNRSSSPLNCPRPVHGQHVRAVGCVIPRPRWRRRAR